MSTIVTQTRKAVLVGTATKYEITSTVTDKGTFDDSGLFLVDIVDTSDPKNDTLVRVIGLGDIDAYSANRTTAITNGDTQYRAAEFVRRYDTLDVAVAAMQVTKDRISTLVTEWERYNDEFVAASEATLYPITDDSLLATRINDYITKNAAITTQQAALDVANDAFSTANADLSAAESKVEALKKAVDAVAVQTTLVTDLKASVSGLENLCVVIGSQPANGFGVSPASGTAFYNTLDVLLVAITTLTASIETELANTSPDLSAVADDVDALEAARDQFISAIQAAGAFTQTVTSSCGSTLTTAVAARDKTVSTSDLTSEYQAALLERTTEELNVTAKKKTVLEATADLEVAKTDADTALASVISLCPDFDINDPTAKIT